MLLKILVWTIVGCVALPAAVAGVAIAESGRDVALGVALAISGGVLAIAAVVRIVALNRAYQDHHRQEVLQNPAEIIARWSTPELEIILAERGLFLGRAFLPFRAAYQRLLHASLTADGSRLRLEFTTIAAEVEPPPREVTIPEDHRAAVRAFVERIRPTDQ